jgi:hypothetical protein
LQEYCDLGTLHHVVRLIHEADSPRPGQLLSAEAKLRLLLLLQDAARGLQALHAQHTVHGDLVSHSIQGLCRAPFFSFDLVRTARSVVYHWIW